MEGKPQNDKQEKLKEEIAAVDASVKTMKDFTSPEQLYQELIASVQEIPSLRRYFADREGVPGGGTRPMKGRRGNPGSPISSIPSVCGDHPGGPGAG